MFVVNDLMKFYVVDIARIVTMNALNKNELKIILMCKFVSNSKNETKG